MTANKVIVQVANIANYSLATLLTHPLLSSQILIQSESFTVRRRTQFLACRVILAELLHHNYAIPQLPEIRIDSNSRPVFVDARLPDFNISHSHDTIAVAITSEGHIGLDIEQHRERKNMHKIAQTFFSAQENQWLNQQPYPMNAFWQLWTLRESALKLYAKGVWQMKEMAIDPISQSITATFAEHFYNHYQHWDDVHLSISCDRAIAHLELLPIK